jgi:hypothetical protein
LAVRASISCAVKVFRLPFASLPSACACSFIARRIITERLSCQQGSKACAKINLLRSITRSEIKRIIKGTFQNSVKLII